MPDPTTERRTLPFADFLAEHNNGVGHRAAGEALQRLVAAVLDTGKKGSLTVKVSVATMDGADNTLVTLVEVKETLPTAAPRPAVFYADDEGNLTRSDPNQLQFDGLKEVEAPVVKDAPAAPVARAVAGGDA